jgi:S1-C subfamily serine protease
VPYVEKDVSRDQRAAQEMVQRTGQRGVPVITVDGDVVIGFDQRRLEQLLPLGGATSGQTGKRLGAAVAPTAGGLLVGRVHPGSLAERAGLRAGDIIRAVNGEAVSLTEHLPQLLTHPLERQEIVAFGVSRDGQELVLRLTPPYD